MKVDESVGLEKMSLEVENVNVLIILVFHLKEMMWDVLVAIGKKHSKLFCHITTGTERDRPRAVVVQRGGASMERERERSTEK